jgi:mannosyl-3-phosphoglycerate phosphatase
MRLVITDLDGTLLDHRTYSFEPAKPALAELRRLGIPLVLCSSKTRAEMEAWQERLELTDPFIVENGGAIIWRENTIELGTPYHELRRCLQSAALAAAAIVRGFGDMSVAEIAEACDLPMDEAALAGRREYDEPFLLIRGDPDTLAAAIEQQGLRCTRGGRFYHILGANDKAEAVRRVIQQYAESIGPVESLGLGDALNDAGFLSEVSQAVLIPSPMTEQLERLVPKAQRAPAVGPEGWNAAVLYWLNH